ncbi:hypothetical protein QN277_013655 [Acacia crassicarpa]|uniref:Nucleotide-diphospho-sugar transferase domain-containing protein n=1 Tax=Acacia crassicarpa TaxID=499986 RepID=A0AAE1TEL1_9FABA|nr:hypothetical protein QN277_013655 [Acacia crassicarpa]
MRDLGLRKWQSLSLTATFFIVLLCFLLFHSSDFVRSGDRRRILLKPPTSHSEREKLEQVLSRATMPDRTVILTMLDEAWASPGSVLDIFLRSFRVGEGTERFLDHLVIIVMDAEAFNYCRSLHPYCFYPSIFSHYLRSIAQSTTSPDHNVYIWKRNYVLLQVLELGYNIIFTDADVMWLRSPLSHFHPQNELSISCDLSSYEQSGGNAQDGGLFFLKSTAISIEFFKYFNFMKVLYPNSRASKSLCSYIVQSEDVVAAYGFRIQYVNTTYFGEFCHRNKYQFREVYSMHANCCEDLRSKVHDLKLTLHDWINSRARSSDNYTSKPEAFRWRAPKMCLI